MAQWEIDRAEVKRIRAIEAEKNKIKQEADLIKAEKEEYKRLKEKYG